MTPPPAAAAAGTARAGAIPATRPAPARRRAPAKPARPARTRPGRTTNPSRRPRVAAEPAATHSLARLLERLIRSRIWIGLVAFALIGIVAMQLWLLKLNGGIGRAIEHEGLLQRENAALSAENSSMAAGDLVEQQAIARGMRIVTPGSLVFLHTRGSMDERLAAARLAQPVRAPSSESSSTTAATPSAEGSSTTAAAPSTESASTTSTTTEAGG
jgi:hypothetical protein